MFPWNIEEEKPVENLSDYVFIRVSPAPEFKVITVEDILKHHSELNDK